MKKILLSVFLLTITIIAFPLLSYADTQPEASQAKAAEDKVPDWLYYSQGLNLKLTALSEGASEGNIEKMKIALECFIRAERSGRDLDRVYFQIADCYYYLRNFEKSVEYARKSIEKNPKSIEPYNRIYSIYIMHNKNDEAAAILEEYCKVNPEAVEVRFALGEHYYAKMKDPEKATESFKQVVNMSDDSMNGTYYKEYAYYYLGYLAFQDNRNEEALQYYEAAYSINGSNLKSVYMLALLYMELNLLDDAKKFAETYLEAYPDTSAMRGIIGHVLYLKDSPYALSHLKAGTKDNSMHAVICRGLYLAMLGKTKEATGLLQNILKHNPNVLSVHLALAGIYGEEKDTTSQLNELILAGIIAYRSQLYNIALPCFHEAVRLKDDMPEPYYYLGRIYEDINNYALAIVNYKKAYALRPGVDLMLHIGYVYGLNKNYSSAFTCFDSVTAEQPKNSVPYFYRGLFLIHNTNYSAAEKNLLKAIELDGDQESYYFYLAVSLEKTAKIKEAMKSLEKALEKSPNSAHVNNYLGYLYADHNINIDRSIILIRKALEEEPENGAYLDSLGWAYYRKGMYYEALEKLLEAERQLDLDESPDSVVYDHIGDAYKKLGNSEEAVRYWEKSLKLDDSKAVRTKITENRK